MANFRQFHGPPGVIDKQIISRRAIDNVSRGQMNYDESEVSQAVIVFESGHLRLDSTRGKRLTFNKVTSEHA
jgi:hypothetical protein